MTESGDHRERVRGMSYWKFLSALHEQLQPQTYLEIGVNDGASFKLAHCASIGVDPRLALTADVAANKPSCLLFEETSDAFFAHRDPTALFGQPVDIAFLDGMHLLEFLLRDFINVERHCRPNSIILLHDCLPPHISMTTRDSGAMWDNPLPYKGWWTGDVWKIIPILQRYRPDLSIQLLDCQNTGLAMITKLAPDSRALGDAYDKIVAEVATGESEAEQFERYWASINVEVAKDLANAGTLRLLHAGR